MNERYALDPAAPADLRELKLLLDQFGLQTGRFLARYPQDWSTLMLERLGATSDMERQRVRELLQRRKACLVPAPASFRLGTTWAGNAAVAVERERAFHAVIGTRQNGYGWPSAEDVLYDDAHALTPGIGAHVPMQAAAYADCVRPLLQASAEVTLVDAYFTLRDAYGQRCKRRWPVMLALLKAAEASGTCQSLRLIFERKQVEKTAGTEDVLARDLEAALSEAGVHRVGVEFLVVEDAGHGRYLLSIHGGLQFDQGFEEARKATNHVHWLSRPELEPLLLRFLPKTRL